MVKGDFTPTPVTEIHRIFDLQLAHQYEVGRSDAKARIQKLKKLQKAILSHQENIRAAMFQDFQKPGIEVDLTEIYPTIKEIKTVIKNLRQWMRPKLVSTPLAMLGSRSYIQYQPKGVVLIISPWNYPVNLTLIPLVTAIAAGNCVMLKPSEHTPHTSALLHQILQSIYSESEIALIQGAVDTSKALLKLPFNHIFFTGAPSIGKIVMEAAAKNLASVTLELGGKSPTIVDETANLKKAAQRINWGKFTNAGQTCIAPDYILVQEKIKTPFIKALQNSLNEFYQSDNFQGNFPNIINQKHLERLKSLLADARDKGANIISGGHTSEKENLLTPTLISDVPADAALSKEEIFGPILPIYTYKNLQDAIDYINAGEKPLALYIFSRKKSRINKIIQETRAGGTSINQTVMHFTNNNLPFGGDNNSGIGKSHGWFGFEAFSNSRAILEQRWPISASDLVRPPYNSLKQKIADITIKWL